MEINLKPTYKQHLAYSALRDPDLKFLLFGGAAGGGKSWLICEWLFINCLTMPNSRWFIGRESLKNLRASTYVTFNKVCQFHKFDRSLWRFNGADNYIEFSNGSRILFLDLRYLPSDPFFERYGSLEFTGGAIEEGGEVHFAAFDTLKTRVGRHLNKEYSFRPKILITANPKKNWLYDLFYMRDKKGELPKDYGFIQALAVENEHLDETYHENLASITDSVKLARLKNGEWEYDDNPYALFEYDQIMSMFVSKDHSENKKYISCDVARFGGDKAIIILWEGFKIIKWYIAFKSGIDEIVRKMQEIEKAHRVQRNNQVVDDDGVGGGVVDFHKRCIGFINNSSPVKTKEESNYDMLKTQVYFKFRQLFDMIEIDCSNIEIFGTDRKEFTPEMLRETLTQEIGYIQRAEVDNDRKVKLLSKDKIKEQIGRSPDFADAVMMRFYFEVVKKEEWKSIRL
jgi:hypothetical protein